MQDTNLIVVFVKSFVQNRLKIAILDWIIIGHKITNAVMDCSWKSGQTIQSLIFINIACNFHLVYLISMI